jgi:hypothetical protein
MTRPTTAVALGSRTFAVGKLQLGPIRRAPERFVRLTEPGANGQRSFDLATTILVVFSSIDQATTPVTWDDFLGTIDALDYTDALTALTTAFVIAMGGTEKQDDAVGEAPAETAQRSSAPPGSAASTD